MSGEVGNEELLWRRVHPKHLVDDGEGGKRISSAEFTDDELSVDRADLVRRDGGDHRVTLGDGAAVAEFSAEFARNLNQAVDAVPVPDNEAHAEVVGKKTKSVQRKFARGSTLLT